MDEIVGTFRYFDFDVSGKLVKNNVLALKITRPSVLNNFPNWVNNTDLAFSF